MTYKEKVNLSFRQPLIAGVDLTVKEWGSSQVLNISTTDGLSELLWLSFHAFVSQQHTV